MAVDVKTVEEFNSALQRSAQSVVHFWASWSTPCSHMDVILTELAKQHPTLTVIRVEAEEVDAVTEQCGVTTVPSFRLYKGTKLAGQLEGADAPALTAAVTQLLSTTAAATGPPPPAAPAPAAAGGPSSVADRIQALLSSHPLLLFMKGTPQQPYCGFSSKVVDVLGRAGYPFKGVDILQDPELRAGVKEFSAWPTFPQLYVAGELVGGCDIVLEMDQTGELRQLLKDKLGAPPTTPAAPAPAAPAAAAAAAAAAGGGGLTPEMRSKVEGLVNQQPVMLFMKGTPEAPRCGFSRKVAEALAGEGVAFGSFDILGDEGVRQGLKELSHWPTYPQVYVRGELLGGCDIVLEMKAAGELKGAVEEMMHRMQDPQ